MTKQTKTEKLKERLAEQDLYLTYDEHLSSKDIDQILRACKEAGWKPPGDIPDHELVGDDERY